MQTSPHISYKSGHACEVVGRHVCAFHESWFRNKKESTTLSYFLKSCRQVFLSKCISLNKLLLLNRFREMRIKIDVSHCYLCCLWYCEITVLKYRERLIVINLRALRNCLK